MAGGKKARLKGSTFERQIAKDISSWTGMHFTRTPMSGGWSKTGDVTPKKPEHMVKFPFNIECKNQNVFCTNIIIKMVESGSMPKILKKWWKQCSDDAKKSKRIPILIMSNSRQPIWVMLTAKHFKAMGLMKYSSIVVRFEGFRLLLWSDFLNTEFKSILKGCKNAR